MALKQLSDGGPEGTVLGQSASDKISFHGKAPISQQLTSSLAAVATNHTTAAEIALGLTDLRTALVNAGLIRLT